MFPELRPGLPRVTFGAQRNAQVSLLIRKRCSNGQIRQPGTVEFGGRCERLARFEGEVSSMMHKAHWLAGSCLSLALVLGCGSAEKRTTGGGTGGEEEEGGSGGSVTGGKSGTGGKTGGSGGASGGSGGSTGGAGGSTGGAGGSTGGAGGSTGGAGGGAGGEGGKGEVGPAGFAGWKYTKTIKMDTTAAGAG